MSSLIILVSGISELLKFKEQWKEFRVTEDVVKSERFLFETNTAPYDIGDAFNLYVKNHEASVRAEQKNWGNYIIDSKGTGA